MEVIKTLRSGWIATEPRTKKSAEYCGISKDAYLDSTTTTEKLNFRVCRIGPNDAVMVAYWDKLRKFLILYGAVCPEN